MLSTSTDVLVWALRATSGVCDKVRNEEEGGEEFGPGHLVSMSRGNRPSHLWVVNVLSGEPKPKLKL